MIGLVLLAAILESINALIKFSQERDVFISNFVVVEKSCQTDLFMMYIKFMTNYQHEHFQVFCDVAKNTSTTSTQDWVIDLNIGL
jgi:hypothetical protein